ncbi:pyruvate kinase [Iodidimonas sp. SYSU 1G8]|uniref:pyruvate kinase n=1 Tax=Iodidimonas sp. SYSU 1G8 TaxID=3133967 RepID=UPI0031FF3DF6
MRLSRSIRILATLGPASSTPAMIRALYEAGADAFRLNMSHGDHGQIAALYQAVRGVEDAAGRPIGILADLQGPKFRVGAFAEGRVVLHEGDLFRLDLDNAPGTQRRASLPHPEILAALTPGQRLLLDDGKIRLRVQDIGDGYAETVVMVGGALSDRKGVNVPEALLALPPLTDKDRRDLAFALDLGVDWIAQSFVQSAADVAAARDAVDGRAGLIAKIEKPQALRDIDAIADIADALMVARGDLGVEMPVEDVPGAQKKIIDAARRRGKLVVVATQMLDSMVKSPVPTRAEVSDVANAVFEGADAVMLSAESAAGEFPVEAVTVMDRVGAKVETDPHYRSYIDSIRPMPEATGADAITKAARQVAETLDAAAIVTYTTSGSTALRAARERPTAPILVLTPRIETARRLTIGWGLHGFIGEDANNFSDMVEKARRIAKQTGFARTGDFIVVTAGDPFGTPGRTNVLRIAEVREED